jgi:hypothetical protein
MYLLPEAHLVKYGLISEEPTSSIITVDEKVVSTKAMQEQEL